MNTQIHPTAVIHPTAELDSQVQVGPYAVIGAHAHIAAETTIGAHVVIEGPCEIGRGNRIFPGAAIGLEPQDLKYKGANSRVVIGNNNIIREYVTINRATGENEITLIGDDNLLMAYVHVAHNCVIEDRVTIANGVAIAGHVHIETKAVIGGVLGIHQFVRVGRLAMLGGMSRIDRDVPPYMLVEGNPARVRSLNLVGLQRAGLTEEDQAILKKAFRLLYRSKLPLTQVLEQLDLLADNEHLSFLSQFLKMAISQGRRGLTSGV